jgi:hypothetical protein
MEMESTATDKLAKKVMDARNQSDFLDSLGLGPAQSISKDYGKERGVHPVRSEAQKKATEKMAAHIKRGGGVLSSTTNSTHKTTGGDDDGEEDEPAADFDILSADRVILFEGKIHKRSLTSMMHHTNTRHMVLFNDVILICSVHGKYLSASNVYTINQVLHLDQISFTPYMVDETGMEDEDEPEGFMIHSHGSQGRPFHLIAESESDKKIWCEEIELAILSYISSKHELTGEPLTPGWQHNAIKGNLISAAVGGDIAELKHQLIQCQKLGRSVDETDDFCMTALHWAVLSGVAVNVEVLVAAGADIDSVNNALNSPLLLAAGMGAVDAFVFLVENGADIFLRNLNDRDAVFMMIMYANDNRSVSVMMDLMVQHGADIDSPDSTGACPLHECCAQSITHSVDILVSVGSDINSSHSQSGLTPLQICCALEDLNPETIRSVLDQGAFPNPKTSTGLTAMDMILRTFFARNPGARTGEMDTDPLSEQGIVYLDDFAQRCLPSLMEVAKHGGKYSVANVQGLRKSLVEAIESATKLWMDAVEPPKFKDFVHLSKVSEGDPKWAADKGETCNLCFEKFTFSLRRHHCRACGALCCDNCSSKRLSCFQDSKNDSIEMLRACDGCFNRSVFSCQLRQTDMNIMDKALRKASIKPPSPSNGSSSSGSAKAQEADRKKSLFSWAGGDGTSDKSAGGGKNSGKSAAGAVGDSVNPMMAQNEETLRALQERGDKLEQVNEKAARMNDAAAEFQQSTARLLQQQKSKQWF